MQTARVVHVGIWMSVIQAGLQREWNFRGPFGSGRFGMVAVFLAQSFFHLNLSPGLS
jgi:hypothetical protein